MKYISAFLSLLAILVVSLGATLLLTLLDPGADFECVVDKTFGLRDEEKRSWTCLHFAAAKGDTSRVLSMLENGSNIEAWNEKGKTPIYEAAKAGMTSTVKILAEHGAKLDARSFNAELTPLHVAAEYNHHDVVRYLIDQGASVNVNNRWLQTPLSQASWRFADSSMIDLLVQRGADINSRDNKGFSPLHQAAGRNKIEILKALIANGANLNIKTNRNHTALMYAAHRGMFEAVKVLLEAGAVIEKESGKNSALYQAKLNQHYEIVGLLEAYGAVDTRKALEDLNSGFTQYENGHYDQAVEEFTLIIEDDPSNHQAYYFRGRSYEKLARFDMALKDLLKAEKLQPGFRDTQEVIAWIYLNKKEYFESFHYYSKVIINDSDNAVAYHNRAGLYYRQGKLENAKQDLKRACDLDYESACGMLNSIE